MSEDSNPFGLESAGWELVKPSERDTSNLLADAACGYFLSWFLGELERKSEKDTDYEWIIKVHISELSSLVNNKTNLDALLAFNDYLQLEKSKYESSDRIRFEVASGLQHDLKKQARIFPQYGGIIERAWSKVKQARRIMPELDSGCQKVQAGNEEESPDPVQIMDGGKELSPPLTREISQPPTVDVNQASPPDKLISKKALVEVLKEIVKDGVNVESVFTNATRNELQRCRAETKRGYWYEGRAINAFFDMGHIKDEYTIRFAEKAIDDSLR